MKGNTDRGNSHRVRGRTVQVLYTLITMQGHQQKKQGIKNKVGLGVPEYISEVVEKD